ncbi:MAG: 50S ribosomal protein P1 [Candidatus Diapherotrites archaeon]|nr:50S ribosomal protein P1 [Candidatus Diapherotrites archaeon]
MSKVLQAAGAHVDGARVKALVASLRDVDIDEAIQKAAMQPAMVAVAPAHAAAGKEAAKTEETKEEEKKTEEEAAEGLGSLFG